MNNEKTHATNSSASINNMSAPPRTKVEVRPLKRSDISNCTQLCDSVQPGYREVFRLNIRSFVDQYVPRIQDTLNTPENTSQIKLCRMVALSRLASSDSKRVEYNFDKPMMEESPERLIDEYISNVAQIQPLALGLPVFATAIEVDGVVEGDIVSPALGLAVLSRLSNSLFLATHSPYSTVQFEPNVFALLVPEI